MKLKIVHKKEQLAVETKLGKENSQKNKLKNVLNEMEDLLRLIEKNTAEKENNST